MMRKWGILLFLGALCVLASGQAVQAQATQTVTFEVQAINEIATSGDPGALVVSAATAGQQPDAVSDSSTTYAITTNETNQKITAALDAAMPAGVTLTIQLAAPTGATSAGAVTLTDSAADVVTGITQVAESGLGITYTLTADVTAGVLASDDRTVTLTIAPGA